MADRGLRAELGYLFRAADSADRLLAVGAVTSASRLLDHMLEAIDRELVDRGAGAGYAMFETLLLEAQRARELTLVKEAVVNVEGH